MILRTSDAIQGIGFAVVFPLVFLAGTFVPIVGMQTAVRTIARSFLLTVTSLSALPLVVCAGLS
jgi:hypothetical protein